MVQRHGHYDGMSKNDRKHLRCGYGEGWSVKNGESKNAVVLERVGEAGTHKEEKKKLAGPLAKKELPDEGCSRTRVRKSRY